MGLAGGSNTKSSVHCDIIMAASLARANCTSRWLIASIARRSSSRFVWVCIEPPLSVGKEQALLTVVSNSAIMAIRIRPRWFRREDRADGWPEALRGPHDFTRSKMTTWSGVETVSD